MESFKTILKVILEKKEKKIVIVKTIIWYHFKMYNEGITISQINNYFNLNHLTKYNPTYLKEDLRKAKDILRDAKSETYKPKHQLLEELNRSHSLVFEKTEDIQTEETIIPESLVAGTRGYIVILANQINASYYYNIFDGCAILMRRLLEILLIHCYEASGKIEQIKENDGYKNLNTIINQVISDKPFSLSKDVLDVLHTFRELGNFSAHRIHYNAKRADINNIKLKYRLTIEELLYVTKFKT
ncbi:DUF4145 domain-containing protein [Pedobacter petrophilus]|uniref:DUF4145 domain-containing protein n=1 Tax=Pedobacter petrophilus TaxID=1908241 RepID=A0A7K0G528_9SPHI|nr:DUF4145 domain-containing protein [Pedobacter petrophilus]MRX78752.1 DUF4145 domain-containing protein [Pedobacter petrophilus]